ncbi:MAG: efflux RND transporter permease subunit [Hyphomicrobiales bacterium]|nr:efflux RND transporter permease subunit [Hyphomicrobiales bacterium]MCP5001971.1 efflux RND transporter permease subunit [Hyphomicrobiales bacterium]
MSRISDELKGLPAFCVRRPVFAIVLNLLVIIAGLAAILAVEVRELPSTDRPVVTIRTTYAGATPETVDTTVTSVLEGAAARIPGVASISSRSSYGSSRITVEFGSSVDIDTAATDLRNAIARAERSLPDIVDTPLVIKANDDDSPIIRIAATTDRLPIEELTQIVDNQIVDRLSAVTGVGDVTVFGDRQPVFKVELDMMALASRGMSPADVRSAIERVTADTPAGSLVTGGTEILVRTDMNVASIDDIRQLRIDADTRVSDVAQISYGPDDRTSYLRADGKTGIGINIVRQAQSNTLEISKGIEVAVTELQAQLPDDVELRVTSDDAVFIGAAIEEVVKSLLISTAIVILVIFLFLRTAAATVIPAVTIPVALIGTVAAIWLVGFSLNILTLLALLLATGMVVDDAIVVLENIVRRRRNGDGMRAAAVRGTREVFFAVIATTATLAAVFIPISFLPGTVGQLFSEFGFVLAIAVAISSFVALTLVPMLASRLAGRVSDDERVTWLERLGIGFAHCYQILLRAALAAPMVVLVASIIFAGYSFYLFNSLPQEITPREDRSSIPIVVQLPQGTELEIANEKMKQIEAIGADLIESGEVDSLFSLVGMQGSNRGFIIFRLVPWDKRDRSQSEIVTDINRQLAEIPGVSAFARQSNTLGLRGGGSGLRFALTGSNYDVLSDAAVDLTRAMEDRFEGLGTFDIAYDTTQAELSVKVDRDRARELGIDLNDISSFVAIALDGREIAEIHQDDNAIPVMLSLDHRAISGPGDLENLFVRAGDGTMVPLSTVVEIEDTAVAPQLTREERMRAVPITVPLADGYDLESAISDLRQTGQEVLPAGVEITLLSEAALLEETSTGMALVFIFAIVIVFLVLAAQFESFVSSIIILLTIPTGVAAAVVAIGLTGGTINVYSQIGIILLVGIMAKNGILIVEFANQLREQGLNVREAIEGACMRRLRPVMMTMASTVFGGLPLILAFGAGAEARMALGWTIVGGLGFATISTLFLTPVAYILLAGLSSSRNADEQRLIKELETSGKEASRA